MQDKTKKENNRASANGECIDLKLTDSNLIDITPPGFACSMSMACPAVFEATEDGSFVIIGELCDSDVDGLEGRVGAGEKAVKISADLLLSALRPYLSK